MSQKVGHLQPQQFRDKQLKPRLRMPHQDTTNNQSKATEMRACSMETPITTNSTHLTGNRTIAICPPSEKFALFIVHSSEQVHLGMVVQVIFYVSMHAVHNIYVERESLEQSFTIYPHWPWPLGPQLVPCQAGTKVAHPHFNHFPYFWTNLFPNLYPYTMARVTDPNTHHAQIWGHI